MTRESFSEALLELTNKIIQMSTLVENNLQDAISALFECNTRLAASVIEKDDKINGFEREAFSQCITLIATQQPIAGDLRKITSALKAITDLERIGDYAKDISDITLFINEKTVFPDSLKEMSQKTMAMFKSVINAYIVSDEAAAVAVAESDDVVDQLFHESLRDLEAMMKKEPENMKSFSKIIMATKYLERIADHATNIAEWIVYTKTGSRENLN